jgi:hypothetical protein
VRYLIFAPMEVYGDSAAECGESEKCAISFLQRSGDRTLHYSGDEILYCVEGRDMGQYLKRYMCVCLSHVVEEKM